MKDSEFKKEAKKRGYSKRKKLKISIHADSFCFCDKCGAPVDKDGKYNP